MNAQTKKGSFIESVTNLVADVVIGMLSQMLIFPLLGYNVAATDQLAIVIWFMIVNWLRVYVIRRWFNTSTVRQVFSTEEAE